MNAWGKPILGRGDSRCQGPGASSKEQMECGDQSPVCTGLSGGGGERRWGEILLDFPIPGRYLDFLPTLEATGFEAGANLFAFVHRRQLWPRCAEGALLGARAEEVGGPCGWSRGIAVAWTCLEQVTAGRAHVWRWN